MSYSSNDDIKWLTSTKTKPNEESKHINISKSNIKIRRELLTGVYIGSKVKVGVLNRKLILMFRCAEGVKVCGCKTSFSINISPLMREGFDEFGIVEGAYSFEYNQNGNYYECEVRCK